MILIYSLCKFNKMNKSITNLLDEIYSIYQTSDGFIFIMIIISLLSVCTLTIVGLCICLCCCKSKQNLQIINSVPVIPKPTTKNV